MEKIVKVADLTPYENNPRNNDEAVPAVIESIKQCGYVSPIVVDEDLVVLAGHTRLRAIKQLGWTEIPVRIMEGLTEEQKKKFRLLDNKTTEFAEWDIVKLTEELEDLDFGDFDFKWDTLPEDLNIGGDLGTAEDVFDAEPPEEPKAKPGQIYQLGSHRLMCGDSTSEEDLRKLIGDYKVKMVYTDPPYGMNLDTDFSSMEGFSRGSKYEQGKVDEFHPEMIAAALSVDAEEVFLWGADYFAELISNRNDGSWIVWDKRANGNNNDEEDYLSDKMYGSCFEMCWSKKRHKRDIARVKWAGLFGLEQEFDRKRHHPTQKPIKLAEWFISRYSNDGDVILDMFGGSGSTLLACEQNKRTCLTIELDPKYVDVIIARWEKYTGRKAEIVPDICEE